MKEIVYREATEQDIPRIAELRAAYSGTAGYWTERIGDYHKGVLYPQKARRPRIMFVACDGDQIVAFIAGHLSTRYECQGELQWIDTIETHRRRGIASLLLQLLGKWFIENAAHKVCVDPGNADARRFYQANGAQNLNEHWMFWPDIRAIVHKADEPGSRG